MTVETYLDQPAEQAAVPSAADYYLAIAERRRPADTPEIVERGRQAGIALGDDPGVRRDLASRVAEKLAAYDDDYLLTTIAGGMRLEEYLRTRTFELVVHGLDIGPPRGSLRRSPRSRWSTPPPWRPRSPR